MSRKEQAKRLVYILLILILVLVIIFSGLRILEPIVHSRRQVQVGETTSSTIERNGIEYFPRQDITVMLLMGIDEFGPVQASDTYKNTGEADMVAVVIFDETNQQIDLLCLNRDTMLEMPALGVGGKNAGTFYGQLALSHTYGTGLEDSCENTQKAVSDFLYGLDISHYVAMNMDAIAMLNDAVGGVQVNVVDDFSEVDASIQKGEMTLKGQQAINYVQVRKDVGDQKNISRMQRQQEYMEGFLQAFRKANTEESFVIDTYDAVSEYMVTDFTTKSMAATLNQYSEYTLDEVITPEGENKLQGQYYAFYADEQKLDELILRLFYAPKN